jgi:hypothetical protein
MVLLARWFPSIEPVAVPSHSSIPPLVLIHTVLTCAPSCHHSPPKAEGQVTVSGGVVLTPTWTKSSRGNASFNIYETDVPATLTEIRGHDFLFIDFLFIEVSIQRGF